MFKKGHVSWNKGTKMSAEACKNMSLAHIGKLKGAENPNWKGGKPKCAVCNKQLTNKVAVHCQKHKPSANKGKTWKLDPFLVQKRKDRGGYIPSKKTREKIGKVQRELVSSGLWKNQYGGYKKDRSLLKKYGDVNRDRRSPAYRDWRNQVYLRDNYACRMKNSECSGKIEAHHILSFSDHPKLRYEVNNGITLCKYHHPRGREKETASIPMLTSIISNVK